MTRAPLMLSDTAMVLLQEYSEVEESQALAKLNLSGLPYVNPFGRVALRLETELANDVWYLWTHNDIPVIRRLAWHLVLNNDVMDLAPQAFKNITGNMRWGVNPFGTRPFVKKLLGAYREACIARNAPAKGCP